MLRKIPASAGRTMERERRAGITVENEKGSIERESSERAVTT
jgi:hypothetical protein